MSGIRNLAMVVAAVVFFSGIIAIGIFLTHWTHIEVSLPWTKAKDYVDDFIINEVDPQNIRDYLRHLTLRPHLGGTEAELENAQWVADVWRSQGLDEVHMVPYEVLLSYPDTKSPNLVRVFDAAGGAVWTSQGWQKPIYAPEEASPEILPNFNAYSASGNVTGDVVFVNFGREEDFARLEELGLSVEGRIVLARYGEIFRANIVAMAERAGAAGVVLYPDPQQYAALGEDAVYPHTVYMPGSAAPDGTVKLVDGDPLTPFYPAIDSAYRLPESEADVPGIPVQPISYDDARVILRHMGGPEVPEDWRGGLNVTYRLGPGLAESGWTLNLEVHTHNTRTTTYNTIGLITGAEEPDRYVMLGNHRDAWIFGAVDPSSGTAAMLEATRVLASLRNKTGWRPRRSVVVCSWGSEEYGLIGSMEWTEQFSKQLSNRAVAYLNVDMAIEGNFTLRGQSVPMLYDYLFRAAEKVPNPDPDEVAIGRASVYDTWAARQPDFNHPGRPRVQSLGSGSDYKAFLHNLGVPSLDIVYTHEPEMYAEPLYHTLYETFALVDELYDTNFSFHAAITKLWTILAVDIADSQVINFNLNEYSNFLTTAQDELMEHYGDLISSRNITMEYFKAAIAMFSEAGQMFNDELAILNRDNALAVRRVNDQLMMVEQAFIDTHGLPGRPEYNHVVMAPSTSNSYAGTAFAGLTDLLARVEGLAGEELEVCWDQFAQHLAAVTHHLRTAANVLTHRLW